jgi:hypothetical protein
VHGYRHLRGGARKVHARPIGSRARGLFVSGEGCRGELVGLARPRHPREVWVAAAVERRKLGKALNWRAYIALPSSPGRFGQRPDELGDAGQGSQGAETARRQCAVTFAA